MKGIWRLFLAAFREFQRDHANRLAAALSYYTAVSIAPLLIFILLLLGFVLGENAAESQLLAQLRLIFGEESMEFVTTIVEESDQPAIGTIAGLLSLITLIWGATNVFSYLQDTLNVIWNVKAQQNAGIIATLRKRLLSFAMVLGIGFLLAASLVLSTVLTFFTNTLSGWLPGFDLIWQVVETLLSILVFTLLFGAIFKVVPDVELRWGDVWPGAALTALLFTVGKFVLSIYLAQAAPGSSYGTAGSVIVFLLWVYYTALILFFGAEFTQIFGRQRGSGKAREGYTTLTPEPVSAE